MNSDPREFLLEKLYTYNPEDPKEIMNKILFVDFIKSHKDCFERNCKPGHITASSWIVNFDNNQFLLTLHKKLHQWLQLGGHSDGDPNPLNVAIREAQEESGIQHFHIVTNDIFDLGVHYFAPEHMHYDVCFLLQAADPNEHITISEESLDLQWFSELPHVTETDLYRMLRKWKFLQKNKKDWFRDSKLSQSL